MLHPTVSEQGWKKSFLFLFVRSFFFFFFFFFGGGGNCNMLPQAATMLSALGQLLPAEDFCEDTPRGSEAGLPANAAVTDIEASQVSGRLF